MKIILAALCTILACACSDETADGTRDQTGIGNRQSTSPHQGEHVTKNQVGIGNRQTYEIGCDAQVKNATMNVAGLFNDQKMKVGNSNADCTKQSATTGTPSK
ncbi:hypothetical protein BH11PSE11_BH11PSE11_03680 [soil metagenome]